MITALKNDVQVFLKDNIAARLCRFAENMGKWSEKRKKKPPILMAARTGSIRRVK